MIPVFLLMVIDKYVCNQERYTANKIIKFQKAKNHRPTSPKGCRNGGFFAEFTCLSESELLAV